MMTTTTTWEPKVGDTVAVMTQNPGEYSAYARRAEVERETAKFFVVGGEKFAKRDLRRTGQTAYGPSGWLAEPDSDEARQAFARQVGRNGTTRAKAAIDTFMSRNTVLGDFSSLDEAIRYLQATKERMQQHLDGRSNR